MTRIVYTHLSCLSLDRDLEGERVPGTVRSKTVALTPAMEHSIWLDSGSIQIPLVTVFGSGTADLSLPWLVRHRRTGDIWKAGEVGLELQPSWKEKFK